MAKDNYTDIVVVLDESGSMYNIVNDTIGGFNSFIEDQKKVPGEATFSLYKFNTNFNPVFIGIKLTDSPLLDNKNYIPNSSTALLDAIGYAINQTGERLKNLSESDRPSKVIFAILTDGEENASREFSLEKVKSMIEHQTNKYNWQFVFLGANIDAIGVGQSIGIGASNSINYSPCASGMACVTRSFSSNVTSYRTGGVSSMAFAPEDRQTQDNLLNSKT